MKIKTDLHNHLITGDLGIDNLQFNHIVDVCKRKLRKKGILGLVNYEDTRYEQISQLRGYERADLGNSIYIPEKEILIIKGQEVPTKQGEVLVLGIPKTLHLKSGQTLEDSLKQAKDNNAIIIAQHPFFIGGIGNYLLDYLHYFDAIEVHNGNAWLKSGSNRKA